MSSMRPTPDGSGPSPARDFAVPLPLREQRVTRREELCARHEEELAHLAKELEVRRQDQESERIAWEKFKNDLEAVQAAMDARQHDLDAQERALFERLQGLAGQDQIFAAREKDLTERSDKLTGIVQRLKQREESINAREAQLKAREEELASRETAVKRETELSKRAPSPGKLPEPLPAGSSLSVGKGLGKTSFRPPTPSTAGYAQLEFREEQRIAGPPTAAFLPSDDEEPSITAQYAGLASPDMSVLMADQVMLRAAAKGSSIPSGEGDEFVFAQPEESLSAISISRVMMD